MSVIKRKNQVDAGEVEITKLQTGRLGDATVNISEKPFKLRGFEHVDEKHRVGETGILPRRATEFAAAYDFFAPDNIVIPAGQDALIWTNIKAYMQSNEVLIVVIRSSFGIKKKVVLGNQLGVIDADYYSNQSNDGNIGICLRNLSDTDLFIERGDRIAQGYFTNYLLAQDDQVLFGERSGGIGSTSEGSTH